MEVEVNKIAYPKSNLAYYYIRQHKLKTYRNSKNRVCIDDAEFKELLSKPRSNALRIGTLKKITSVDAVNLNLLPYKCLTARQYHYVLRYKETMLSLGFVFYIDELGTRYFNKKELESIITIIRKKTRNPKTTEQLREYNRIKQQESRARKKSTAQVK